MNVKCEQLKAMDDIASLRSHIKNNNFMRRLEEILLDQMKSTVQNVLKSIYVEQLGSLPIMRVNNTDGYFLVKHRYSPDKAEPLRIKNCHVDIERYNNDGVLQFSASLLVLVRFNLFTQDFKLSVNDANFYHDAITVEEVFLQYMANLEDLVWSYTEAAAYIRGAWTTDPAGELCPMQDEDEIKYFLPHVIVLPRDDV